MDDSRKMDFFRFPPEIRNIIYILLVTSDKPIKIMSPRAAHEIRRIRNPSNFCQLLGVNKQMNDEASAMFYAVNAFVFGNGPFGARDTTNQHALRAFLKRVPAKHLARITQVHIEIHARRNNYWNTQWRPTVREYKFGTLLEAEALRSIIRALMRHFTSLEKVAFQATVRGAMWLEPFEGRLLTDAEVAQELNKAFVKLLRRKSLKYIEARAADAGAADAVAIEVKILRDAVEKTLKMEPGAENVLSYPWKAE